MKHRQGVTQSKMTTLRRHQQKEQENVKPVKIDTQIDGQKTDTQTDGQQTDQLSRPQANMNDIKAFFQ